MAEFEINEENGNYDNDGNIESFDDLADVNSNFIEELSRGNEVEDFTQTYNNMFANKSRRTIPFLTKYEKARIVGKRAMQISKGAPPLVEVGNLENPVDIALKELSERKIPYIIRRTLPNGMIEDWRVDELRIE